MFQMAPTAGGFVPDSLASLARSHLNGWAITKRISKSVKDILNYFLNSTPSLNDPPTATLATHPDPERLA